MVSAGWGIVRFRRRQRQTPDGRDYPVPVTEAVSVGLSLPQQAPAGHCSGWSGHCPDRWAGAGQRLLPGYRHLSGDNGRPRVTNDRFPVVHDHFSVARERFSLGVDRFLLDCSENECNAGLRPGKRCRAVRPWLSRAQGGRSLDRPDLLLLLLPLLPLPLPRRAVPCRAMPWHAMPCHAEQSRSTATLPEAIESATAAE